MYIDTDDYAASGIEVLTFPGGEPHANVPKWRTRVAHIFAKIRNWEDFGWLCAVGDALYSQGVRVHLFMPYLPGARQDRNTGGLTPLTPRIYAASLYWATTVTCADPHSIAAMACYNDVYNGRLTALDIGPALADLVGHNQYDFVLCPDHGALARAQHAADLLGVTRVLHCEKTRDEATGKLSGFKVPFLAGHGLLVDDICDGGGTFAGIHETMEERESAATLDLFVTHGIFSKGFTPLQGFENLYTTDSFYQAYIGDRVSHINLINYYFGGLNP